MPIGPKWIRGENGLFFLRAASRHAPAWAKSFLASPAPGHSSQIWVCHQGYPNLTQNFKPNFWVQWGVVTLAGSLVLLGLLCSLGLWNLGGTLLAWGLPMGTEKDACAVRAVHHAVRARCGRFPSAPTTFSFPLCCFLHLTTICPSLVVSPRAVAAG